MIHIYTLPHHKLPVDAKPIYGLDAIIKVTVGGEGTVFHNVDLRLPLYYSEHEYTEKDGKIVLSGKEK